MDIPRRRCTPEHLCGGQKNPAEDDLNRSCGDGGPAGKVSENIRNGTVVRADREGM